MANEAILIVDDNAEMLQLLGHYVLSPLGYRVTTATDGEEGLRAAIEDRPDLILLDMCMPRMTGLEMLAALRQTDCTSPVVFMTSYESVAVAVEAFRMGVRDYIRKPFSSAEVEQTVDRALRESRLEREREDLNRTLMTAEAVRSTVITLSHYLINHVMAIGGAFALLHERLRDGRADPDELGLVQEGRSSVRNLLAVMGVLRRVSDVKLVPYFEGTPMIDIASALEEELAKLNSQPDSSAQMSLSG